MLSRILFTWRAARKFKKELKIFYLNSTNHLECIESLSLKFLIEKNIKLLILDFDGVLAPHGAFKPEGVVQIWMENLFKNKPKDLTVAVLSNLPRQERYLFFKDHFSELIWVCGVKKKPYPEGILKLSHNKKVAPENICLVDDRLLTGILASLLAGTQALLITQPRNNFKQHFFKESFFSILRQLEKLWVIL